MKVTTQPTANSSKSVAPSLFWKFGADFHGNEAARTDTTDFVVFTLIGLLCAWPIVSVGFAIVRVFLG